jgi:hypothetical protein
MDFQKLIDRVKNILLTPKTEWPVIAAEPTTVKEVFLNYVMILAAIPAIFAFLSMARISVIAGLAIGVMSYGIALAVVYLMGFLVNTFATNFGGEKNEAQAMKSAAYAYTANAIASIGAVIPFLGILISLAGAAYAIYLLYLGLPSTMKCPPEKAGGYAAVCVIISWVVGALLGMVVGVVVVMAFVGSAIVHG